MEKLIDFDGLFEEKLAQYMRANAGKYTEKQWEALIPKLYKQFGDTFIPKAKNTPKGYYAAMSNSALAETLARHIQEGIPVSDFLCRELETRDCPPELTALLQGSSKELALRVIEIAGDSPKALEAYFALLGEEGTDEAVAEAILEQLYNCADAAKPYVVALYQKGKRRELMLDLLSRVNERDDEVFSILLRAFTESGEELTACAGYLAQYGDVRALDDLLDVIDRDDITYPEYLELRCAIEALGGEYRRERDFTNDPAFLQIAEQSLQAEKSEEK